MQADLTQNQSVLCLSTKDMPPVLKPQKSKITKKVTSNSRFCATCPDPDPLLLPK
jgi:hypothetical protein